MIWLSLVIGSFLFYYFVEWRHKVLIFKITGGIFALGAVAVGVYLITQSFSKNSARKDVSIEWIESNIDLPQSEVEKIVTLAHLRTYSARGGRYPNLGKKDLDVIRAVVFSKLVRSSSWENVIPKDFPEYWVPDTSEMSEEKLAKMTKEEKRTFQAEQMKTSGELIKQLEVLNKKASTGMLSFLTGWFVSDAVATLKDREALGKFQSAMHPANRYAQAFFEEYRNAAHEELYEILNSKKDVKVKLSFRVCNERKVLLDRYSFYVSGKTTGRSSKYGLEKSGYSSTSTRFEGDVIVKPESCTVLEWPGAYKFFGSYEVFGVGGTWNES